MRGGGRGGSEWGRIRRKNGQIRELDQHCKVLLVIQLKTNIIYFLKLFKLLVHQLIKYLLNYVSLLINPDEGLGKKILNC